MKTLTIEQKEQALRNINFFVGGLTDEAIEYYYNKLMKKEELIRYYKANIEAIEKGLNNDSLSADEKFRLGYTQQGLNGYKSALQELLDNNND